MTPTRAYNARRAAGMTTDTVTDRKAEYLATSPAPGPPPYADMVWIPGGAFVMGSEQFYPEERPIHPVSVDGFWMDRFEVTIADFRRFVQATGYVTVAERPLNARDYPGVDPALLVPGSLVFQKASGAVRLDDYRNWWR
jgi:formylglycine-generating enzyme